MFEYHPKIVYNGKVLTDILAKLVHVTEYKKNLSLFQTYVVKSGETPEYVGRKFYGADGYGWLILFINDCIDPYLDWCLSESQLKDVARTKYEDLDAVHHYVDQDGDITNSGQPVTNFEYEISENEKKREILVLKPSLLDQFLEVYEREMNG